MANKETDHISGVETTGHEWDGIKELNNPLPRWWLWVFYACIIWSIGYWIIYPAWPTLTDHTEGSAQWTQFSQLKEQQAEILARKEKYLGAFHKASLEEIRNNPELYEFALAGGNISFKDNCATCHGTGGSGGKGYPNLNDDDWLWGGSLQDIYTTLEYGIRSGHEQAHDSQMPAFGKDGILSREEIAKVADYTLSLSGKAKASEEGEAIFEAQCSACHGPEGKGGREFGAPNLTDAIWLYGSDRETVITTIANSRRGVMPAWKTRLSDETIKQLTIYVHSLGGGE